MKKREKRTRKKKEINKWEGKGRENILKYKKKKDVERLSEEEKKEKYSSNEGRVKNREWQRKGRISWGKRKKRL